MNLGDGCLFADKCVALQVFSIFPIVNYFEVKHLDLEKRVHCCSLQSVVVHLIEVFVYSSVSRAGHSSGVCGL